MPVARVFIDSTTLLYTIDEDEPDHGAKAEHWLKQLAVLDAGCVNLQVLNEVANVVTRKARFRHRDPFLDVDAFSQYGSAPLSPEASLAARDLFLRYGYSWWDCVLLASALELGCTHFLSEDMQDGQSISNARRTLTIVNPFAHSPEHIFSQ